MTRSLILLGTGGSAHDVLDIIEAINAREAVWTVTGFLDDALPPGSRHLGLEILGPLDSTDRFPDHWFINVIGSDKSYRQRPEILAATRLPTERFATLIHPAASVSSRANLGIGGYVNPGVVIAGGVTIGNHVTLGPGVIVGHDSAIEDFAILAPGAIVSGFVRVGRCAYIGTNATLRQRIHVGNQALVGMGAVVVKDVPPGSTVVGNPARVLFTK